MPIKFDITLRNIAVGIFVLTLLAFSTIRVMDYSRSDIERFQRAVARNGNDFAAHCKLGEAYGKEGDHVRAIVQFRKALDINPDCAAAHYGWGNSLVSLGRQDEAIVHYHMAIRIKPNADVYRNMAGLLNMKGQFRQAAEYCQKAINLAPDSDEVYTSMGVIHQNLGNYRGAEMCYEKALAINPDNIGAHDGLGSCLYIDGKFATAITHLEKVTQMKPDWPDGYFNLANALISAGRTNDGMSALYRALPLAQESHNRLLCTMIERKVASVVDPGYQAPAEKARPVSRIRNARARP